MLLTCIDPRFPQPTINDMKCRKMIGKQVGEKQPSLKVELGLMSLDGKVEMFS